MGGVTEVVGDISLPNKSRVVEFILVHRFKIIQYGMSINPGR
jgi:hypothetical protein